MSATTPTITAISGAPNPNKPMRITCLVGRDAVLERHLFAEIDWPTKVLLLPEACARHGVKGEVMRVDIVVIILPQLATASLSKVFEDFRYEN